MTEQISTLAGLAASIGFLHTLLGPDHYLPFIVISKARKWTLFKTIFITFICGLGHVGSSILIGILGIVIGYGIGNIEGFESTRGDIAAWAIIIFGFGYLIYGIIRLYRKKPHKHLHIHNDGTKHEHKHTHEKGHDHVHKQNITPWLLFIVFVLGPCEPLIPYLMYPAAQNNTGGLILITSLFAIVTIATMIIIVTLGYYGLKFIKIKKIEKYMHIIAGATIMLSGMAIVFLGL